MCMGNSGGGSTVGNVLTDVVGGVADYFSGGTLTPYLAATIAGQAVGAYAQSQQLKKQNDAAAAGIIKQGELQKQGEGDVAQTTKQIAQSSPAAATAAQLASFQKALQEAAPQQSAAQPSVPGASKAYNQEKAAAGASATDYLNKIASSAATTEGTQLERVQEGQKLASTASDLGLLSTQSNEQSYLTKLQIQSQQANPWLTALSRGLEAYGAAGSLTAGAKVPGVSPTDFTSAMAPVNANVAGTMSGVDAGVAAGNNAWLSSQMPSAFGSTATLGKGPI